MTTRRTLLLTTIAAGGILAAFAGGAAALSGSHFRIGDDHGPGRHATRVDYREGHEGDRHHERRAERDHERRYAEHDDDEGRGGQAGPARAGSTPPPDNGLIRKGSTPKVQSN